MYMLCVSSFMIHFNGIDEKWEREAQKEMNLRERDAILNSFYLREDSREGSQVDFISE